MMKRFWPWSREREEPATPQPEIEIETKMESENQTTQSSPTTEPTTKPTTEPTTEPMAATPEPAQATEPAQTAEPEASGTGSLRDQIIEQLKTVFDPEIPVNIYELGLIYDVDVEADGATRITMTLTSPSCPAAEELPPEVETKAREVAGVTSVQLDLVWEPTWSPDMMSEAAKLDLGM